MCLKSSKVKQMVSRERSGPEIWLLTCSRWGTQMGWGPGENPSLLALSQLRSLRGICRPMTWSSEDSMSTYTHLQSPEEQNLSSRLSERRSHQSSNLWKKQWDITNSESAVVPTGPGPKLTYLTFILLMQIVWLQRVPTICFREKLFLKVFQNCRSIHQTIDTNLSYLKFNLKGIWEAPTMCQSQLTF